MKEQPKMDILELGKRIRTARRKKGMSQAELADKVGISVPYVSDVENGKKTIGVDIFLRIAEALQVSTDWLLRVDIPQNRYVNHSDAAELLEDCTSEEALMLLKIMASVKDVLRQGKK